MIWTWQCQKCGYCNDNHNGPCHKCGAVDEEPAPARRSRTFRATAANSIKGLIAKALRKNPIVAEAVPDTGIAIVYTIRDEVLVLKIDMTEEHFSTICDHVRLHGIPEPISTQLA